MMSPLSCAPGPSGLGAARRQTKQINSKTIINEAYEMWESGPFDQGKTSMGISIACSSGKRSQSARRCGRYFRSGQPGA